MNAAFDQLSDLLRDSEHHGICTLGIIPPMVLMGIRYYSDHNVVLTLLNCRKNLKVHQVELSIHM
jgi:hypothetical protein